MRTETNHPSRSAQLRNGFASGVYSNCDVNFLTTAQCFNVARTVFKGSSGRMSDVRKRFARKLSRQVDEFQKSGNISGGET